MEGGVDEGGFDGGLVGGWIDERCMDGGRMDG